MSSPIHVAVGVIRNAEGRVLIARRPAHLHQGGLWEFPGGKVEPGEDVFTALRRELQEELGIRLTKCRPLISLEHDYGDKKVWLDVHSVDKFAGEPYGCEGQDVRWVTGSQLSQYQFPAANRAILNAVRLPDRYMITGEFSDDTECLAKIRHAVEQGVRLVQLRANHLPTAQYLSLAQKVVMLQSADIQILLNADAELFEQTAAAGLHLNRHRLMQLESRPVAADKLLSVSVHNRQELVQANRLGADMVLVSPIMPTSSHRGAITLGWDGFADLVQQANCPAYALGGMKMTDVRVAKQYGAQGVAGISLFE